MSFGLINGSSWFWSLLKWACCTKWNNHNSIPQPGSGWKGRNGREGWGSGPWRGPVLETPAVAGALESVGGGFSHIKLLSRVVWRWSPLSRLGYLRSPIEIVLRSRMLENSWIQQQCHVGPQKVKTKAHKAKESFNLPWVFDHNSLKICRICPELRTILTVQFFFDTSHATDWVVWGSYSFFPGCRNHSLEGSSCMKERISTWY